MYEIVHYGDPILRKVCKPVRNFEILPAIVEGLFDTMYEAEGIGLAANQAALDINLFVLDLNNEDHAEVYIFVNGKIIDSRGESTFEEGCLSLPEIRLEVKRPEFITFRHQDLNGQEKIQEFEGLAARAIQHEMDHLNGVLIIDRIPSSQRLIIQKDLKSIKKSVKSLKRENVFLL